MEKPIGREKQIIDERIKKIEELRAQGVNPYAYKFEEKRDNSEDLKKEYEKLKNEKYGKKTIVAGRIMAKRSMGKISFLKLQDFKGNIQIVLQKDETPDKIIELSKKLDSGDIIGISGKVFRAKSGELSIMAENIELLTKAILPLPEKWHGLKDDDEKLRKRYLDIIINQEIKEIFIKKQKFWGTIRNFLIQKGFIEVETPILENNSGGAAATPFITHHNALDLDVYLRISMGELWQKKLLIAGYEKTFEIGRQFRNEGMDMEHLQDYTQMEFYMAYSDYEDGMKLVEELYKKIAKEVLGNLKFESHGYKVDLGKKWEKYDYEKIIKKYADIDIYKASESEIKKKIDSLKIECDKNVGKWRLIDILWKYSRKKISGPGFLINQPVEVTPLAKRNDKDTKKVQQFQVIIAGTELGNGYSELNDPLDQEKRFKEQRKLKEAGDSEAHEHDEYFIEALKYGMPPTCGFGVSERLFSYLMDKPIRETVIFPLVKNKSSEKIQK